MPVPDDGCADCPYCGRGRLVGGLGRLLAVRRCGVCRHPLGRHGDQSELPGDGVELAQAQEDSRRRGGPF